jgi:hypothetical protein
MSPLATVFDPSARLDPGVNPTGLASVPGPVHRTCVHCGFEGVSDCNGLCYRCWLPFEEDDASVIAGSPPTIVRVYLGAQQSDAVRVFEREASELARFGYQPTTQSWAAGRWGRGAFFIALLLTVMLVGLLMLLYLLVAKPDGTLTVTYALRDILPPSGISAWPPGRSVMAHATTAQYGPPEACQPSDPREDAYGHPQPS